MLAFVSRPCLAQVRMAHSAAEAGLIPAQRKSELLRWAGTTLYALKTALLEPTLDLMNFAAKHGCLKGMRVLRVLDLPCEWSVGTCRYAE